jgi:hypothetical protein
MPQGKPRHPAEQQEDQDIMTPTDSSSPANQPTYVEEPAIYYFQKSLAALTHYDSVAVNIDRDTDFLLTGINGSSTTTNYTLNLRLPSGRLLSSAEMLASDFIGTPNQPTAIGPPPIYRAGSVGPQLNLTNLDNAVNNINISFSGIRRVRTT